VGDGYTTYPWPKDEISDVIIGNGVTAIGEMAFSGCPLISVIIPDSVTGIGWEAFRACQLTSVTIGNGVTMINGRAFMNNPLTSITIGANVDITGTDLYSASFDGFFENTYNIVYGKQAGTYTMNGVWSLPGGAATPAFTRTIEIQTPVMNGQDIVALQKRLLSLGYSRIGEADGYYGPLSEEVIKFIQRNNGRVSFDEDGKVNQALWNFIFDNANAGRLKEMATK